MKLVMSLPIPATFFFHHFPAGFTAQLTLPSTTNSSAVPCSHVANQKTPFCALQLVLFLLRFIISVLYSRFLHPVSLSWWTHFFPPSFLASVFIQALFECLSHMNLILCFFNYYLPPPPSFLYLPDPWIFSELAPIFFHTSYQSYFSSNSSHPNPVFLICLL